MPSGSRLPNMALEPPPHRRHPCSHTTHTLPFLPSLPPHLDKPGSPTQPPQGGHRPLTLTHSLIHRQMQTQLQSPAATNSEPNFVSNPFRDFQSYGGIRETQELKLILIAHLESVLSISFPFSSSFPAPNPQIIAPPYLKARSSEVIYPTLLPLGRAILETNVKTSPLSLKGRGHAALLYVGLGYECRVKHIPVCVTRSTNAQQSSMTGGAPGGLAP